MRNKIVVTEVKQLSNKITDLSKALNAGKKLGATHYECVSGFVSFYYLESEKVYLERCLNECMKKAETIKEYLSKINE